MQLEVQLRLFLIIAPDGNKRSVLRSGHFTPGKELILPTEHEDGWIQSRFGRCGVKFIPRFSP